ncbi:response regulator transcription factor [Qipengyuania qiaonensis]|uniref:Helix-turn-helix transcriptional regulator n=1 Tax=Qipengyuania qiaonensis TaxID=2867240 RepID=A0ABS7J3M7_9SPHN|nr:helix-turn-helix transcriptional regulator [Qipengyuania qiaonensis]MBX7480901.1 helix-turn-helix transcriptional regulator [Qipengyuania qiaonensis]
MNVRTFIVVDRDFGSRNKLVRNLSHKGYVIPLDRMDELGDQWPEDAWVFVGDEGGQVLATAEVLGKAMQSYPLVAYGKSPIMSRVLELINGPCIGYVQWPVDGAEFWRTFEALERRIPMHSEAAQVAARARRMLAMLTDREREIAHGISHGLSTKEMAGPLGISPRTIEVHRGNILAKLDAKNMADLVRLVVEAEIPSTD